MKANKKFYSLIAVLLVAAISLSMLPTISTADNKEPTSAQLKEQLEKLEEEKAKIEANLADLEGKIQGNRNDVGSIMVEKAAIEEQVQLLYNQIMVVNAQIATYNSLINQKEEELDEANKRYTKLNAEYKKRIRAMEEAGELSYWSVLFKANSFSDFLDRLNMIGEIASSDQRRLEELKAAADAVAKAQKELEDGKAELEASRKELLDKQAQMDVKSAQADEVLQQLLDAAESYDDLYDEFEKLEDQFMDEIVNKKEEYDNQVQKEHSISASKAASIAASVEVSKVASKKASQQASKDASIVASKNASIQASKNQATAPTGGGNSNVGDKNPSGVKWLVPCSYSRVSSPFGYRWHPTTGEWTMHKGVDLAAPKGTPIYATRSGKVTVATYHATAGNYVTIDHLDGYRSTYMHMTHYVVKWGEQVKAGQLIGYVGSTGRSTGPHLHFGILLGSGYVNPMDYIG